ncbi:MAG TPA: accessory factor UbiK family protein [Legionellaceae bacterium]|nr:accessory factor UbiK family protein [Legionellaceae bacterium]
MLLPKQLEDLAKKLYAILPKNVQLLEEDMKQQFKDILQSAFTHLDLVTREEFDVQIKVLARSREKIDALEKEVQKLLQEKNKSQQRKKTSPLNDKALKNDDVT